MARFSVRRNKDASDAYVKALEEAGHELTKYIYNPDFWLIDNAGVGSRREAVATYLATGKPMFIYPHTPLTYWLWDGVYDPPPISCNFVSSEGAKEAMSRYGYEYRVEVVGFPRCEVLPFTPTEGKDVLFVPARPRRDSGRQVDYDQQAFEWLQKHRDYFGRVKVCPAYENPFDDPRFEYEVTFPKDSPSPANDMLARTQDFDIIISCNTAGALAVAQGKPTIFYGEGSEPPQTTTGSTPKNYEKYRDIYEFPLLLENMTPEDVLATREAPNEQVEAWKTANIGGNFDADLFVKIIESYL